MAKLHPDEREALLKFSQGQPLRQPGPTVFPFIDYLRSISRLPDSLRPLKPVRFIGQSWKL